MLVFRNFVNNISNIFANLPKPILVTSKRLVSRENGIGTVLYNHIIKYPTPGSISYAWSFGSLLGFYFVLQLVTGVLLTSYYNADTAFAFHSVIEMTSQTKYGINIRYMHANGASIIFILLYLHIARGLYFRSYVFAKRWAWISGLIIFILMMATAFIGYVLPWGQMSFWGVTVITNLLTVVPYIGNDIHVWLMAGYSISSTTLARFYALHVIIPLLIAGLICVHIFIVHKVGSTSGTQVRDYDKISFHPYFTVKDLFGVFVSLIVYFYLVFCEPNLLGHTDNYIEANPMVTPPHIVPEWYFTPFYAILRAFPNKTAGAVAMGLSLLVLGFLPWIHYFSVVSWNKLLVHVCFHKPVNIYNSQPLNTTINIIHKILFWFFCVLFLILIFIGSQPAEEPYVFASRLFTFLYFSYFLAALPLLTHFDFIFIVRNAVDEINKNLDV